MRKLLLISTTVFLALQLSVASTYYVATNGVNTHAGSSAAPWKTVVYGSSKLKDGDTLRIKPGTYLETEMVEIPENNISVLADDPINRPTIDFNDKMNYYTRYVEAYGRSNFTWDGVNIKNAGGSEYFAPN